MLGFGINIKNKKGINENETIILEIADYIFVNPDKKPAEILSEFVGICRKSERTVERYIKNAREYNKNRIQEREKARNDTMIAEAKEDIKRNILTRNEAEEILTTIAKGGARKVPTKIQLIDNVETPTDFILQYPSDGERTRAIDKLAEMNGWDAPIKTESDINFNNENPLKKIREALNLDNVKAN